MTTPEAPAHPANRSPAKLLLAASHQPVPTASGSVDNSVAGASQSSQSRQSGSSAGSDNLEVFLSFHFVRGLFLYLRV